MNTLQIDHALGLSRAPTQEPIFRGTFALNHVPFVHTLNPPFGLVVNTEPSSHEGDHWIALFQSEPHQPVDILDTRGYAPSRRGQRYIRHLVDTLKIDAYRINRLPLQSYCSSVCGEYCILFIDCRRCGWSFESFLSLFSERDLYGNDCFVYAFVHHYFDILNYPRFVPAVASKTWCIQISKRYQKDGDG